MAESDIASKIVAVLEEYTDSVRAGIDEAVTVCGKGLLKEVRASSPKLTSDYKKGWRNTTVSEGMGNKKSTIHNKTDYQLTHLLEKPHRKRGNNGNTTPTPHIAPAEKKWTEKFEKMCEEACKSR